MTDQTQEDIEIEERIRANARPVPPLLVLLLDEGTGVLPQTSGEFTEDDAVYVLKVIAFDPQTELVVELPLLFSFDQAVDAGILSEGVARDLHDKAVAEIARRNNPSTDTEEASK